MCLHTDFVTLYTYLATALLFLKKANLPRVYLAQLLYNPLCASGIVKTNLTALRNSDPISLSKCFTTIRPNVCGTAVLLVCLSHFPSFLLAQSCDSSFCFQNICLFLKPVKDSSLCLKVNTSHINVGQLGKQLRKP